MISTVKTINCSKRLKNGGREKHIYVIKSGKTLSI